MTHSEVCVVPKAMKELQSLVLTVDSIQNVHVNMVQKGFTNRYEVGLADTKLAGSLLNQSDLTT